VPLWPLRERGAERERGWERERLGEGGWERERLGEREAGREAGWAFPENRGESGAMSGNAQNRVSFS
jgi:hypothetical protein